MEKVSTSHAQDNPLHFLYFYIPKMKTKSSNDDHELKSFTSLTVSGLGVFTPLLVNHILAITQIQKKLGHHIAPTNEPMHIIGVSGGCLASLVYCFYTRFFKYTNGKYGYSSALEIFKQSQLFTVTRELYTSLTQIKNVYTPFAIYSILAKGGIVSSDILTPYLSKLITTLAKVSGITLNSSANELTMLELYEMTGSTLEIVTTHLKQATPMYISHITHPNLPVIVAIKASMTIEILMQPVLIDDQFFIDGGLSDNLPVKRTDDPTTQQMNPRALVLTAHYPPVTHEYDPTLNTEEDRDLFID